MAGTDLPFPNNMRTDTSSLFAGARFGRKKKTVFLLLVAVIFFVLWFNSDLNSSSLSLGGNGSSSEQQADSTVGTDTSKDEADNDSLTSELLDDDDELSFEEEENTPEIDKVTSGTAATTTTTTLVTKPTIKPLIPATSVSKQVKPQHFKYFIVIASRTSNQSRRQLIRETYFGQNSNLEPCMKRDKGIGYMFWVYGQEPAKRTAERRLHETEKMEWNDLEITKADSYKQDTVLRWAESTLTERGITFDYLIIQDGYSLVQLNSIQQQIQADVGQFPLGKSPVDLAWVHNNIVIAGSEAIKKLFEQEAQINDVTPGASLMTHFYDFYKAVKVQLNFVNAPRQVASLKSLLNNAPYFIDGQQHRFMDWNNNVEAIPETSVSVSNIYQDQDFVSIAKTLSVGAANLCKPLEKATIAVVTSSFIYPDSCMEPSAALAASNKRDYALAHNYAFVARSAEFEQQAVRSVKRKTVWGKIDVVQKVLPKYDWIFWMDMDAVIMNPDQTVQSILDDLRNQYPGGPRAFEKNIDLVIAKPTRDKMINAGVFFMRNTAWAQQFLNAVQESAGWFNQGPSFEQGAMWDLIQTTGYKEHVLLLENDDHTFNTLPSRYKAGDFIVHFAPDKCPSPAVLSGLNAAERIAQGEIITSMNE